MKSIVLDLKSNTKLVEGDILIYDKNAFTKISKSALLRDLVNLNNDRISDIKRLEEVIKLLDKRIMRLELELKYNRGEITQEEYENELGTIN